MQQDNDFSKIDQFKIDLNLIENKINSLEKLMDIDMIELNKLKRDNEINLNICKTLEEEFSLLGKKLKNLKEISSTTDYNCDSIIEYMEIKEIKEIKEIQDTEQLTILTNLFEYFIKYYLVPKLGFTNENDFLNTSYNKDLALWKKILIEDKLDIGLFWFIRKNKIEPTNEISSKINITTSILKAKSICKFIQKPMDKVMLNSLISKVEDLEFINRDLI